mmetsp:Transcript_29984/g.74483  ORF Transcript_29984/g.74483 Transcript_29984/m.74483 type:complete len:85 (-) Transcript_29984:185-439(-)
MWQWYIKTAPTFTKTQAFNHLTNHTNQLRYPVPHIIASVRLVVVAPHPSRQRQRQASHETSKMTCRLSHEPTRSAHRLLELRTP